MFKKGAFKEDDIVKYVGDDDVEFHVKVMYLRSHVGCFAGEVVYIGGACEWFVGDVSDEWLQAAFVLVDDCEQTQSQEDITQLQQKNTELEYTIETLKQRLIEAERNALYWTVFDCPVNRDIAERILRKGHVPLESAS